MQVGGGVGPVPLGDDHVALDPPGPRRRLGRHLAGHDAAGPVGVHLERGAAAHAVEAPAHAAPGLPGLDAAVPGRHQRVELAELGRNLPRRLAPEPVTGGAPTRLEAAQPRCLVRHVRRNAVPVLTGARELVGSRHLEQRVPVAGRIVLRRRLRVGRDDRRQIEVGARRHLLLGRIDEPVAAHPDVVGRLRQVRHDVAALVVGDHGAVEPGRQVHGLGDHPDPRLGPVRPGHDPADVVVVDGHGHLGAHSRLQRQHADGQAARKRSEKRHPASRHLLSPCLPLSETSLRSRRLRLRAVRVGYRTVRPPAPPPALVSFPVGSNAAVPAHPSGTIWTWTCHNVNRPSKAPTTEPGGTRLRSAGRPRRRA